MTSIVQKVLEAEKRRHRNASAEKAGGLVGAAKDLIENSGIFKGILGAQLESETMERNKLLPAIEDKKAITAYKMLRTRVLQRMRSNKWKSLVVTAAGSAEGKTVTACNLAVSISNDVNQSIILIDLDLQRPSIASYFGLTVDKGIDDFLAGNASIEEIVYSPQDMDRLAIIPARTSIANSSEFLASPKMRQLMQWIAGRGENAVALFDMPPVLACDDVLAFLPLADAILLVTAEGHTERTSLYRTMEMLAGAEILGIVLNKSREHHSVSNYY